MFWGMQQDPGRTLVVLWMRLFMSMISGREE